MAESFQQRSVDQSIEYAKRSPGRRRIITRRTAFVVLLAEFVVLLAICAAWLPQTDVWRRHLGDMTIRGSHPPVGAKIPMDLGKGSVRIVLVTCASCPQGIVAGNFLTRLDMARIDKATKVDVFLLGDEVATWRSRFLLPARMKVHVGKGTQGTSIRKRWFLPNDGAGLFMYDRKGMWRSTFLTGQLNTNDVLHDAAVIKAM